MKWLIYFLMVAVAVGTVVYIVYINRAQLGLVSENGTLTEEPSPDPPPSSGAART